MIHNSNRVARCNGHVCCTTQGSTAIGRRGSNALIRVVVSVQGHLQKIH